MSLGKPDLYIGGQLMQSDKADPRPALAGLTLQWGTDNRVDFDPGSTLTGQILIRGAFPSYLDVGAPVGLIDPASSRTLFAGYLLPLKASPEERLAGAYRISFTAASPISELEKHTVVKMNWPIDESANDRRWRLGQALPADWSLLGASGLDWIKQGQQKYRTVSYMDLLARYLRGNLQRYHDTSVYIPSRGLQKRISITEERGKTAPNPPAAPARGGWVTSHVPYASGLAVLPRGAVGSQFDWEKTPDDVVTAVQVTTTGKWLVNPDEDDESPEHEWPLDYGEDTSALQRQHGLRIARIETALSPQNVPAAQGAVGLLTRYWTDVQTQWRPTNLTIPDSRLLDTTPLRNLLAVDTRHMAAVAVPGTSGPGRVYAFATAGSATWTGKKWETELTLGRTL